MKKHSNVLESTTFFNKVKSWVYNLFHKAPNMNSKIEAIETRADEINDLKSSVKRDDFFKEYKQKNERREYLLNLQRKYKAKEILEQDMSKDDRSDLENLYIEQNNELKRKIRSYNLKISKLNLNE